MALKIVRTCEINPCRTIAFPQLVKLLLRNMQQTCLYKHPRSHLETTILLDVESAFLF